MFLRFLGIFCLGRRGSPWGAAAVGLIFVGMTFQTVLKIFYEVLKTPRHRGPPRRAGRNFYSHAQNVYGTVLGENRAGAEGRRGGQCEFLVDCLFNDMY